MNNNRTPRRCAAHVFLLSLVLLLLLSLALTACQGSPSEDNSPDVPSEQPEDTPDEPKVFTPKNVIMISVQGLGDGLIEAEVDGKALMPGLRALLDDFSYYKNNVSASAHAAGLDIVMSSSAYAPQFCEPLVGLRGDQLTTLAKILSEKDFYTLAVASGPRGAYGGAKTYESFGYQDLVSVSADVLPEKSLYDMALSVLKSSDSEHFLLSITDLGLYTGKTDVTVDEIGGSRAVANYAKRMAYTDAMISSFIEALKSEGLYEECILVITGTGAAFDLEDTAAVAGLAALTGEYTLETHIKAPLLVKLPGVAAKESVQLTTHSDVFVTLTEVLGIDDANLWRNGKPLDEGHDKIFLQSVLKRGSFIDASCIVSADEGAAAARSCLFDRATKSTSAADGQADAIAQSVKHFEDYDRMLAYGLSVKCYENGAEEAMSTFEQQKSSIEVTPEQRPGDVPPESGDTYKNDVKLFNKSIMFCANEFKGTFVSLMYKNGGLTLTPGATEGTFISDEVYLGGSFDQMLASWNSYSDSGTVEVSVSVRLDDGSYTGWYSWGKWSAIKELSGSASAEDENGEIDIDILSLKQPCRGYVRFKVDIKQIKTNKPAPTVHNVTLACNKQESALHAPDEDTYKKLNVPYRRQTDVPVIGGSICSATSLSMILLYRGEKGLEVEDVAWGVRDYGAKKFGNWAYNVAYAGELGYNAYLDYVDIDAIKWAVYNDHPVACSIRVKQGQLAASGFPNYTTSGHLLCVVGYEERNGQKWLLINDPAHPEVKALLESEFDTIYRGVSYIVQTRPAQ